MRKFTVHGCSDTGLVRTINEDHILVGRFIKNRGGLGLVFAEDDDFTAAYGMLFAVADGIGGENAGEIASKLALQVLERHFYSFEKVATDSRAFEKAIEASAKRVNETILQMTATRPELKGMGCTLVGIGLSPQGYYVFNAGDSRVYRLRASYLRQLTEDDSLVGMTVRMGRMTEDEAAVSEQRHTITNSLGSTNFTLAVQPVCSWQDDDRILICSDGLHDLVPLELIEKTINAAISPEEAVNTLVALAKENGGHDNISVILVHCSNNNLPV